MAKFYGKIGYADNIQTSPGVWEDVIVEKDHYGDVLRTVRRLEENEVSVNNDIKLTNTLSIVSDAYLSEHFFAIRYVRWMGGLWTVPTVEVQPPRLILRLGGVYHGPTA